MAKFEDATVPFVLVGNRRCLTDFQLHQQPWLREFVERFAASFEYDPLRCIYLFEELVQ